MQAVRGTPLFKGHRAWGSLFGLVFLFILMAGATVFSWLYLPQVRYYVIIQWHSITVLYILAFLTFIIFLVLLYKHYRITYIISTKEIIVRKGIIGADIKSYVYDRIQEIGTFQTAAQRILLYGQMSVTLLISLTGQATPETAILAYLHRPKYLSNLMVALLKIGQ